MRQRLGLSDVSPPCFLEAAIDAGNNIANLASDERGDGFVRSFGAATDIGAFEAQPVDVIFRNGFD
jgi:hypothetical protein